MIFNVPGHIGMIRKGIKRQSRRISRGCYREGKDYAVQEKRGIKAEPDIRIVMDDIWEEDCLNRVNAADGLPCDPCIFYLDAAEEGLCTPEEYEREFKKAYPKWDGKRRWVFLFHVVAVQK